MVRGSAPPAGQIGFDLDTFAIGQRVSFYGRNARVRAIFTAPHLGGIPQQSDHPAHEVAIASYAPGMMQYDSGEIVTETMYLIEGDSFYTWAVKHELEDAS